jgi:isochorismate synthase
VARAKTTFQQFFDYCHQHQLPFACYRLPGKSEVEVIAQKNTVTHQLKPNSQGFVFAPFAENGNFKTLFINADVIGTGESLPALNFCNKSKAQSIKAPVFKHKQSSKHQFKQLVKKLRQNIRKGKFAKVVAARVALKAKPQKFKPVIFFNALCKKYPQAFVSLVSSPQYGLWIGASPEVLAEVNKVGFTTYSLAGTKANNKLNAKAAWGTKEKEEQQLVSDYVVQAFKKVAQEPPKIAGPVTVAAGNLLHLRTTFLYKDVPVSQWIKVVNQLHPTPAVAGLPKQKAVDYILTHEKSPRAFYSGYLGPVNMDSSIHLFVNLRCMQVLKNKLALYVGCGITKDSKPELEWKESKIKTETLLNVLR